MDEFVEGIKRQKVVVLDDLASEWKMRTADVVNRLTALEQSGRITGIMDERGMRRGAAALRLGDWMAAVYAVWF